jgi:integrase
MSQQNNESGIPRIVNTRRAAEILGRSPNTLKRWRYEGVGPDWIEIERIDWHNRLIFNPDSKTRQGRRWIPMSERVCDILRARCADREEGWVFPSCRRGKHITGGLVNKQWVAARKKAGLPDDLVLYCARHDYGTYLLQSTGNLKAVMDCMGHVDVKTAMKYQHPELEIVRMALDSRHTLRHTGANGN